MTSMFTLLLALQVAASGSITGSVTDAFSGRPLGGVTVEMVGAGILVESGGLGEYSVHPLPPGWHKIRFRRMGAHTLITPGTENGGLAEELSDFSSTCTESRRLRIRGDEGGSGTGPPHLPGS